MPPVRKEKPIPKPAPAVPNIPGIKPYEEKPAPVVPGIEITSTEFKHLPLKPGYAIRQIKQGSTIVEEFYVEDKQSENLIPDETPLEVKLHNLVQEVIDFLPDHRDKTNQLINELNKSEGELFYNQIMNKLTEIYSLIRENPNTPREVLSTILLLSEDYLTKDRIHLKSLIDSLKNEIVVKNNTIDIHNQRILSLENRLELISIVERLSESEESNIVNLVIRAVQSNFPVTNQNDYGCTINSRGIQTLVSLDFKTVKIDFSFNKADKNKVAYLISLPGTLVQKEKSPEEIESALYQEIDLTCRNLLNLLNEEKEILPSLLNKTASKTEYLRLNETLSNYTSLEQGISNFRENQKNHPETFVGLRTAVLD